MSVSVFDLFKIGIGPSSSHTVGPMRAAARFAGRWLAERGQLDLVRRIRVELFGSLAHTGRGHGTDKAVMLGLEGEAPDTVDVDQIQPRLERIRAAKSLFVLGQREIPFDEKYDLAFNKRQKLPYHSNGMRFTAFGDGEHVLATRDYYSVGGGFVVNQDEAAEDRIVADTTALAYPFHSGDELLAYAAESGKTIAQVMLENELAWRKPEEVREGLLKIWRAMQECVAGEIGSDSPARRR